MEAPTDIITKLQKPILIKQLQLQFDQKIVTLIFFPIPFISDRLNFKSSCRTERQKTQTRSSQLKLKIRKASIQEKYSDIARKKCLNLQEHDDDDGRQHHHYHAHQTPKQRTLTNLRQTSNQRNKIFDHILDGLSLEETSQTSLRTKFNQTDSKFNIQYRQSRLPFPHAQFIQADFDQQQTA